MAVFAVLEDQPGGLADLERQFRGNDPVGPAANAVGAEIATNHDIPLTPAGGLEPATYWPAARLPARPHTTAKAVNLLQKL